MKFGIAMFPSDSAVAPGELGRIVEAAGFESLFFPEHSHIPAARESHFDAGGGDLPSYYWRSHDLFTAMAFAAAATSRLTIGSGLCLISQRDPIWAAKSVASLDQLSGGRIVFGIGPGWNKEEMEDHRYEFRTRFSRMRDHTLAMKALWTEESATHHGRDISFSDAWAWPKPLQEPHPPLLIGGAGSTVLDRVLDYGDGWLAEPADGLEDRIRELDARAARSGRDIAVTIYGAEVDTLGRWALPLVDRCVFWVEPGTADVVRAQVADLAGALGLGPEGGR